MEIRFIDILTLIGFLSITMPLSAQDIAKPDTTFLLDEVVVSYRADKLTPVTFQNIGQKDLKIKSVGQEPSFILAETPSITAYSDAGSTQGYSYYRLRGIDQTRINMTFDGIPMNEPEDQGAYFSNYPDLLNSVDKIHIQRGVGTSKNGSANYAGSIQLFSPNLRDTAKTAFGLGYGAFNSLRAFVEYKSGLKNNKALYVRASEIYSDGYKYHSANHSQSIFVSGSLFYNKSIWKINVLAGHQQNDMAWLGASDSLINIDRRYNPHTKDEKDNFFQTMAQVHNSWQLNEKINVQSAVFYTFLDGNYNFDLNNYLGLPLTNELYNYDFRSHWVGFFSNFNYSIQNLKVVSGIQGNLYQRRHTGSEKNIGELYKNTGFKNETSLFAKAEYSIKKINFYADIQYRYADFDYRGSVKLEKLQWHFVNPKAGISYEIADNMLVYYSIGRVGREPTRNDIFLGEDDLLPDENGKPLISNTAPEYVTDHELGLRRRSKKVNLNANLFYMNFDNEIVLNGNFGKNGLALTENVEQSFRTGIEIDIDYHINKYFILHNNSSFNYSRIKEQSVVFSPILTPKFIVNQEFIYNTENVVFSLSAKYQSQSYIDFANTETIKGYFLLNARMDYLWKHFTFSVYANNITNTKYFNYGYVDFDGSKKYFVQSPVNLYGSIIYSF